MASADELTPTAAGATDQGSPTQNVDAAEEKDETQAFVTLLINDEFAIGVEVLLYSLRQHSRVKRPQVVLVTADVSDFKRQSLNALADHVLEVIS